MKKKRSQSQDAGWAAHRLIESLKARGDDDALEELHHIAGGALEALQKLATKGNDIAAKVLIMTLNEAINQLYEQQGKQREIFSEIAGNLQCWPGFVTVEKDWKALNENTARNLRLGNDAPLNYGGKSWTRDGNPENVAALELINRLTKRNHASNRLRKPMLPPLNKDTAGEWWKVGRPLIEKIYGEKFEQHPLFAAKYASKAKTKSDASLSKATWQRKQILSKIAQAFRTLARKN
jgi:hypothetical protein